MADKVSRATTQDFPKGSQDWASARVTAAKVASLLGRVTRGALLSVGVLTVAGVTGAGLMLQVGSQRIASLPSPLLIELMSPTQGAAKEKRRLPEDFVLVMDIDGTNMVEKADPDPFAKVTDLDL